MAKYVIGDGGHGRCLAALIGATCIASGDEPPEDGELYVGLGLPSQRRIVFNTYSSKHLFPFVVLSDMEIRGCIFGKSVQIMPGSLLMPGTTISDNVLINTGSQIDHDCVIGAHSVISPGAILCGNVTLGEGCHIGAGAIIVQGVKLEPGTFVPAGTLVCGPTDFRRPPRAILAHRTAEVEGSAPFGDAGNI